MDPTTAALAVEYGSRDGCHMLNELRHHYQPSSAETWTLYCRSTGSTSSRPWLQAAANGDAGSQSMHSSASAEDLQARLVAGSPIRASLEDPHQQQKQSQNYAADGSAGFAPLRHPEQRHQVSDSSDEQHAALSAVREVGQEVRC